MKNELNEMSAAIVDSAFKIHKTLGPGLLESAYGVCPERELKLRGLQVERQKPMPFHYEGMVLDAGYRLDLVVNDSIIIELKSIEALQPIHKAQLPTYMRLSGVTLGFLINFNVPLIKTGIQRHVLNFQES